jgi:hypothetical protein
MIYYCITPLATSPNTMDGSPARWIVPNHQLHVAGSEGGSATMVRCFCRFLCDVAGCRISSSSSYVEKWYDFFFKDVA